MTNTTDLDAAIVTKELDVALQAASDAIEGQGWSPRSHIYAIALIDKLTDKVKFVEPCDTWADGFNAGISEIRRRAGLEVES